MNKFVQNQTFYENIDSFNDIISGIKESDKRFVERFSKRILQFHTFIHFGRVMLRKFFLII